MLIKHLFTLFTTLKYYKHFFCLVLFLSCHACGKMTPRPPNQIWMFCTFSKKGSEGQSHTFLNNRWHKNNLLMTMFIVLVLDYYVSVTVFLWSFLPVIFWGHTGFMVLNVDIWICSFFGGRISYKAIGSSFSMPKIKILMKEISIYILH